MELILVMALVVLGYFIIVYFIIGFGIDILFALVLIFIMLVRSSWGVNHSIINNK